MKIKVKVASSSASRPMKKSGVEWIGLIPENWDVQKVKNAFVRKKEEAHQEKPVVLSLARSGVKVRDISTNEGQLAESYYNYNLVVKGDLLINPMDLYSGANCSISNVEGVISPAYINLRAHSGYNPRYYDYYFKTQYWSMAFFAHGKGVSFDNRWTLSFADLNNYLIPAPLCEEQTRIANYLDLECARIDSVIEMTRESIEEYKILKQSIITEAVTKGIRPDRHMKDSGSEWIGEIPDEWNAVISRFVLDQIGDVDHYMPESVEVGIPYVMTGDLKKALSHVDFDSCKKISYEDYEALSKKIKLSRGDIIFARYATIGTVCYVDVEPECIVSYSCVTIKPSKEKLFGKYLYYYLQSSTFFEDVSQYINSNTQGNVGIEALYKVKFPVPSIEEQSEISEYLDAKINELDILIVKKEELLSELNDYKKAIIFEYVTGKKEVPA